MVYQGRETDKKNFLKTQQNFPPPAPLILLFIGYYFNIQLQTGQQTISCFCELYVCIIHPLRVPGVVSMGGDSLAAAVSQSFPVVLFLYSADTSQDAAGRLSAAGSKKRSVDIPSMS